MVLSNIPVGCRMTIYRIAFEDCCGIKIYCSI